jgi:hypothetical protein
MKAIYLIFGAFIAALVLGSPASAADGKIHYKKLDKMTKSAFLNKFMKRDNQIARGLLESTLIPIYPEGLKCHKIDHIFGEPWKGPVPDRFHTGADIPAPWDEPIHAMADGEVVAKFPGNMGFRGLQLLLRHSPEDTGLPVWVFTLYSHFNDEPNFSVGDRVKMGQYLGPNGKTGSPGKNRAPHLHLSVYFNDSGDYAIIKEFLVPQKGHYMDPVALFKGKMPLDTNAMRDLPGAEKQVKIAYKTAAGEIVPAGSKIIWPYICKPEA